MKDCGKTSASYIIPRASSTGTASAYYHNAIRNSLNISTNRICVSPFILPLSSAYSPHSPTMSSPPVPTLTTPLTTLLSISHPILLAGMAHTYVFSDSHLNSGTLWGRKTRFGSEERVSALHMLPKHVSRSNHRLQTEILTPKLYQLDCSSRIHRLQRRRPRRHRWTRLLTLPTPHHDTRTQSPAPVPQPPLRRRPCPPCCRWHRSENEP